MNINETFIIEPAFGSSSSLTGGTFDAQNKVLSLFNSDNTIITVDGFTDNYTTGATIFNNVVYFDRNDVLSAYTLNLSAFSSQDTYITGGTYSNGSAIFINNTGGTFTINGFYTGNTDEDNYVNLSGDTMTGQLNAPIISGGTLFGNISGVTGLNELQVTNALGYTPYNSTNPNGYISGYTDTYTTGGTYSNGTITLNYNNGGNYNISGLFTGITSNNVTTALGFTPYNSTNPSNYISGVTSNNVTTALGFTPYNSTNPNGYISGVTSNNVTTALGFTPYNSTNPNGYISGYTDTYTTGGTYSNGTIILNDNSNNQIHIAGLYTGTTNFYVPYSGGNSDLKLGKHHLMIGDEGSEGIGINVNGVNYEAEVKISDIGGTYPTQLLLHRHSTQLPIIIGGARSNSDDNLHNNLTNGQVVISLMGAGYAGTNYKLLGGIDIGMDDNGTISDTSSPSKISFNVTPDGDIIPVTFATFNNNLTSTFNGTINAPTFNSGSDNLTFVKGDGSLDSTIYLSVITSGNVTTALGYTPLSAYTYTTGGTYSNGTAVFTNSTGGTYSVTGLYTGTTGVYLPLSGGTLSGIISSAGVLGAAGVNEYYGLGTPVTVSGVTQNTAVGTFAMYNLLPTSSYNTAVGYGTMTWIGSGATYNTAVGNGAMFSTSANPITGTKNTALGYLALTKLSSGTFNTGLGYNALAAVTTGITNTAVGGNAGLAITIGQGNTLVGYSALQTLTTGSYNVAIGRNQTGVITGNYNTILGSQITGLADVSNTIILADGQGNQRITVPSTGNVIIGNGLIDNGNALQVNGSTYFNGNEIVIGTVTANSFYGDGSHLTGISGGSASLKWYSEYSGSPTTTPVVSATGSTAIGSGAVASLSDMFVVGTNAASGSINTSGSNFIGYYAGYQANRASDANFIGYQAGYQAGIFGSLIDYSNFIGYQAGYQASSSVNSNFIGSLAGRGTTGSSVSNFIGYQAGYLANASLYSNFMGYGAGANSNSSQYVNYLGYQAGYLANASLYSNFMGYGAGANSTTVSNSSFIGINAGANLNTVNNSNFIGNAAGSGATSSYESNFIGYQAGYGAHGSFDSNFFGYQAGILAPYSTSANFIGYQAGFNSHDSYQSNFIGYQAGYQAASTTNSNFIGFQAGIQSSNIYYSNFLGFVAGGNVSGANSSNFMGNLAGLAANNCHYSNFFGYQAGNNATGSTYSNFIGFQAGQGKTIGGNNIIIGTNVSLPNGKSDSINIGGILFGTGTYSTVSGIPSIIPNNGKIGINVVNPSAALHVSGGGLFDSLTATTISVVGGTNSQFLKADGSLDSTTYAPNTTIINTISPLTGGTSLSSTLNLGISKSDAFNDGYLSSSDWQYFYNNISSGSTLSRRFSGITRSITLTSANDIVLVSGASGTTINVNLPLSTSGNSNGYTIKNIGKSIINIIPVTPESIDGNTLISISSTSKTALTIIPYSNNWWII